MIGLITFVKNEKKFVELFLSFLLIFVRVTRKLLEGRRKALKIDKKS